MRKGNKYTPNLTNQKLIEEISKYYYSIKSLISDFSALSDSVTSIEVSITSIQSDV